MPARASQSRSSGEARGPTRLQLLIGGYIVAAGAIIFLPALLYVEGSLKAQLIQRQIQEIQVFHKNWIRRLSVDVRDTEQSVEEFSRRVADAIRGETSRGVEQFDQLVAQDPDGAWRSIRSKFDPARDAGIWIPRGVELTDERKQTFMELKRVTELFGVAVRGEIYCNTWVLPATKGIAIFWPDQPNFIYDAGPTHDYDETEWVRLTRPEINPEQRFRWTNANFDPVPKMWLISAVAPVNIDGEWVGAVGHDIQLSSLLETSDEMKAIEQSHFFLLGRDGTLLAADLPTAFDPQRPPLERKADRLKDARQRKAILGLLRVEQTTEEPIFSAETDDMVAIGGRVEGTGWLVVNTFPRRSVVGMVDRYTSLLNWMFFLSLTVIFFAIVGVISRDHFLRQLEESRLRESRANLQGLFNTLDDVVFVVDLAGRIVQVNSTVETRLGYAPADLIGKPVTLLHAPSYTNELMRLLRDVPLGVATTGLIPLRTNDGVEIPVETRFGRGTWYGKDVIYGVARDIAERLAADAEKQDLEAQVRYAQKLESLGVLAGGIAHDFNNLLTGILGHADLALLDLPANSPAQTSIAQILVGAKRAADLAKQMLAYSGKGRFVVEKIDLADVVREMSGLLETSVSKKCEFRYRYDASMPLIEADATQMRQVVMNLILNASEAIGNESGHIDVRVGSCECTQEFLAESVVDDKLPAGRYAFLEVEDTGAGMSEETLARIFDPFFTTKFTGRGLGLAAVLGIVRGHRGVIQVSSVLGQGTTFRVLIPVLEDSRAASLREESPAAKGETPSPDWKGEGTILLVDDEAEVRSTAESMLRRLGFDVIAAANGAEAVQLYRQWNGKIHAVLLDLSMPEMDGEETFGALREIRGDVAVILSSGFTEQDVIRRFRDDGLAGFVQKPYTLEELRKVMSGVSHK